MDTSSWYELVSGNAGKCVDASGGGTANGTPLIQWSCGDHQTNQQWQFSATDSGYYRITNRNSAANGQVIDVPGDPSANGTALTTWGWNGGANQQWMPVLEGDNRYHLVSRSSGKCLDVTGASTADGTALDQWTCNGGSNQSFQLAQ
ncbi:RICIN domain-containing protein [Streptomyces longwoodensis]|uniref:RICIN domain-containing protein n=1 Tax=Streptomyces longwoodensis TaxID=68231 RepID=UPI0033D3A8E3